MKTEEQIFNEIYGRYYLIVYEILREAAGKSITLNDISKVVNRFADSGEYSNAVEINEDIRKGMFAEKTGEEPEWDLLDENKSRKIQESFPIILTDAQKSWLKSMFNDPKVRLFCDDVPEIEAEELFSADDIVYVDRFADGDNFYDERYIENFRVIFQAVKDQSTLKLTCKGDKTLIVDPDKLEYSEKDDKFRLFCLDHKYPINLSRIINAEVTDEAVPDEPQEDGEECELVVALKDEKNAVERFILSFSNHKKSIEKLDEDGNCRACVTYDKADEKEMIIRIMSLGPYIKVVEPQGVADDIKRRLEKQADLLK